MSELNKSLKKASQELCQKISGMMEDDAREVIIQAIKSGDFARYVMPSNSSFSHVYIPFKRLNDKESEIQLLKRKLERAMECVEFYEWQNNWNAESNYLDKNIICKEDLGEEDNFGVKVGGEHARKAKKEIEEME